MADGAEIRFSEAALAEYREVVTRYPSRQAALLPTLWIAQREFGWISPDTMLYVANLMELPPSHVRAVVTFYTMYHTHPVGRHFIQVCTTSPCGVCGATIAPPSPCFEPPASPRACCSRRMHA